MSEREELVSGLRAVLAPDDHLTAEAIRRTEAIPDAELTVEAVVAIAKAVLEEALHLVTAERDAFREVARRLAERTDRVLEFSAAVAAAERAGRLTRTESVQ